jgi:hypothetical protein
MLENGSFKDILQQACELRSYSDKKLRKKYGIIIIIITIIITIIIIILY